MGSVDRKKLPVEIQDNDLPEDISYQNKPYLDEDLTPKSSGFTNAIFLGAVMVVCFLWGMLTIILKGA